MIRSLKILLAVAMAMAAFGAIGASGAQAAEFHCSVEPCTYTVKPDGTVPGKTSHQVMLVKQGVVGVVTTCDEVAGEAKSAKKTTLEVTFQNIKYTTCSIAGQASTVNMNGCGYLIKATGAATAAVTIECEAGKSIEHLIPATGCIIKYGAQGPLNKVFLHDSETNGVKKSIITMSIVITETPITGTANNKCGGIGFAEGPVSAEHTTGNVELLGETPGGILANAWFE